VAGRSSYAVVIDPTRAFGAAIVSRSRVPTQTIYKAHLAGDTVERIASWYEIELAEVRAQFGSSSPFAKNRER